STWNRMPAQTAEPPRSSLTGDRVPLSATYFVALDGMMAKVVQTNVAIPKVFLLRCSLPG
ncbi:hypothetical protein, partial [Massilia timonae]|uniref:hypothetical protein n=1 Tax=Massilia timonae TaxID=47229 RepID=UPI00289694EA